MCDIMTCTTEVDKLFSLLRDKCMQAFSPLSEAQMPLVLADFWNR
jgi:hypothetical protein